MMYDPSVYVFKYNSQTSVALLFVLLHASRTRPSARLALDRRTRFMYILFSNFFTDMNQLVVPPVGAPGRIFVVMSMSTRPIRIACTDRCC
jgi:hypothetical protein